MPIQHKEIQTTTYSTQVVKVIHPIKVHSYDNNIICSYLVKVPAGDGWQTGIGKSKED